MCSSGLELEICKGTHFKASSQGYALTLRDNKARLKCMKAIALMAFLQLSLGAVDDIVVRGLRVVEF